MENLVEQLANNTRALKHLKNRYEESKSSVYFRFFKTEKDRNDELDWVIQIQKRVLRLRERILMKIMNEAQLELNRCSSISTDINSLAA